MAEGPTPRRVRPRPLRAAYGDAGTCPAEMRRRGIRLPALPSRLLSVLAVLPAADAASDYPAWQTGSAGAPAGVHHLLFRSRDLHLERPAAPGAAGQLGGYRPPRSAGEGADAPIVQTRI